LALDVHVHMKREGTTGVLLINDGSEPVTVLVWNTPFDDMRDVFRADIFDIVHPTEGRATYTGIVVKRLPTFSDFITINPGQMIGTELDLRKGYHFPVAGEYEMTLNTYARVLEGVSDIRSVDLKMISQIPLVRLEAFTVRILIETASPPLVWERPANSTKFGTIVYTGCDDADTQRVVNADSNMGVTVPQAKADVDSGCTSSYQQWFGACNAVRQNTVSTTLGNINTQRNAGYGADCTQQGCGRNTFAFVYPNDKTHTIHLCSIFFSTNQNQCQYDSTGGTLVHEMSHFTDVGGTGDYAYGTAAAQQLAQSDPAKAVNNADNYEYYTESCP